MVLEFLLCIWVNVICFGVVCIRFVEVLWKDYEDLLVVIIVFGWIGELVDIVSVVVFLVLDVVSWIIGEIMIIDGGLLFGNVLGFWVVFSIEYWLCWCRGVFVLWKVCLCIVVDVIWCVVCGVYCGLVLVELLLGLMLWCLRCC